MWFRKKILFEIKPYVGVGPVQFGSKRCEVRKLLGENFKVDVRGGPEQPHYTPMDYYEKLGVFAYYNDSDTLDALEFVNGTKLWFHQKELFSKSLEHLFVYFSQIDPELKITDDGFESKKYGIGMWVSCVEDTREQTAETIIVYKRNYYIEG